MKASLVYKALASEFGATDADRVQGGFVGILFVEKVTNELHYIDETGAEVVASAGGATVVFA